MRKLFLLSTLLMSILCFCQENDTIKEVKTLEYYLSSVDKFTGEKVYYAGIGNQISISKYIKKNYTQQYISIDVEGSTLNYGCYGVSILFDNGKQINRPNEKVDTNYRNGWKYSVFFVPTPYEINLFKTARVIAVKLYIYSSDITIKEADEFKEAANIILKSPIKKKK